MAGFLPHCVPRTWTLLLAGPPCWSSSHLLSPSLRHWPRSLAAAPSCSPSLLVGGRGSRACACVVDVSINLTLLIGVFLRIFTVSVSIVYPSATTPPCAITPHATSAALSLGIAPMIACVGSQTGLSSDPRSEEAHRPATPPLLAVAPCRPAAALVVGEDWKSRSFTTVTHGGANPVGPGSSAWRCLRGRLFIPCASLSIWGRWIRLRLTSGVPCL
jgi:hypothetical protein